MSSGQRRNAPPGCIVSSGLVSFALALAVARLPLVELGHAKPFSISDTAPAQSSTAEGAQAHRNRCCKPAATKPVAGERLPSLKSPECPTHLARPVGVCVAMEDSERGGKQEKRRDTADVREKAAPVRHPPFRRPDLGPLGLRRRESLSHPLGPLGAPVLVPVGRPGSAPLTIRQKGGGRGLTAPRIALLTQLGRRD